MKESFLQKYRGWMIGAGVILAVLALFLLPEQVPHFYQTMTPLGDRPVLTALAAFIPSLVLMLLMSLSKLRSMVIVLISLFTALLLALFIWRMPLILAGHSILFGMSVAVFPLLWALLNAMWIFRLLIDSGYFETLRHSLQRVSPDKRVQSVLVGFGLTALIESIAAFGAPIVIVTAMLMGLGFPAHLAAAISLVADSAPSSWGTQGLPILMLNSVTGLDPERLGMIIGWQTPILAGFLPVGVVLMVSGWKGFKGIWPIPIMAGLSYAAAGILSSQFMPVSVTGMTAGLVSILVILLMAKWVKPQEIWLFNQGDTGAEEDEAVSRTDILRAWSPFIVLILVMGLFNGAGLVKLIAGLGRIAFPWPQLDGAVYSVNPHTAGHELYAAFYDQDLLTTGGTLTLLAGFISAPFLRMKPGQILKSYREAFKGMLPAGSTIALILGMAYLMNYSGMAASIGLAVSLVSARVLAPLMVLLGLLGCLLSGSVSGSNALFGGAALFAASRLSLDPHMIAGSLCSGGTMGKPITPQNLILAEAAIGRQEEDTAPRLMGLVFRWVLVYTLLMFALVWLHSLWFF